MAQAAPLTVLELFTSQGCSSCPAAEKYIASLAKSTENLLVLSFHVDYWDRLGWEDPYAEPEFTERQYDYSNYLSNRPGRVYTPQMVINGHRVAGSPYKLTMPVQLKLAHGEATIPLTLTANAEGLLLNIPAGKAQKNPQIWLVGYNSSHTNEVKSGENHGYKMTSTNTVHTLIDLGEWNGNATQIPILTAMLPDTEHIAILIQESGPQKILGATTYNLR